MEITVDTNVLIRSVVRDHPQQAKKADKLLKQATLIAIALPVLCEFVWVLRSVYGLKAPDIAAVQALMDTANVAMDRTAAEAGLALLMAGGDFADGVIAHEGLHLGGQTFVSFDRQATSLLSDQGHLVALLSE